MIAEDGMNAERRLQAGEAASPIIIRNRPAKEGPVVEIAHQQNDIGFQRIRFSTIASRA